MESGGGCRPSGGPIRSWGSLRQRSGGPEGHVGGGVPVSPGGGKGEFPTEFSIGELYLRGWGMPRDEIDAPRWIETAANGVDAENQPRMGWQAAEGYGMPQDFEQAAYWFQRAAEKGHAEAEYQLGRLYAQGHGLPHDEKEAAKWVEKAASQGHALAQARLGMATRMKEVWSRIRRRATSG